MVHNIVVTQAKNAAGFLDALLCFLKHYLVATLLLARRISEQQRSSGNVQDMEIMETQLQIQLSIKADSIIVISLYKTWKKPNFSLSYGSLKSSPAGNEVLKF